MQLRSQLRERLEGRELVKGFLKHIAKARGVSPESLVPRGKKQEHSYHPIIFIRPSKQSSSAVKAPAVILPDINQTPEKIVEDDEPEITSAADEQGQQNEFILEPVLEEFADAPTAEIAEENIAEEVPEDNLRELNSSVIPNDEDEEETKDDETEDISTSGNFDDDSEAQAPQPILSSADLLSELDETAEEEHEKRRWFAAG